jgi:hypothetical protein
MGPADLFLSRLIAAESRRGGVFAQGDALVRELSPLLAPRLGAAAAEDLCRRTLDRLHREGAENPRRLGYMAAFFLEEYDEASMALTETDWQEIRETLEDLSGDMPLDLLTALMGDLLSRGKLPR